MRRLNSAHHTPNTATNTTNTTTHTLTHHNPTPHTPTPNQQVTRFVFICNYVSRVIEPLASRCAKFRFRPLHEGVMRVSLRVGGRGA